MPQFTTRRRVRHSAAEMFDLVADVERYPEFVPLCRELKVRRRTAEANGSEVLVADIEQQQFFVLDTASVGIISGILAAVPEASVPLLGGIGIGTILNAPANNSFHLTPGLAP